MDVKKIHGLAIFIAGAAGLASQSAMAQGADAQSSQESEEVGEIIVTGFRASLQSATNAKRESTNFTDSVFAEDIGKFADLNIAEALNRIPGVQLSREVNGDGMNIAIRGLGTNFTKIMLNGAQISVASSGAADTGNQNREVDLDLFPTELFTRLDVSKTPTASMLEGGVSGVVNMRSARAFDNPGTHFSLQAQGTYGEIAEAVSPRASLTASWTNETFGVLVGAAYVDNKFGTKGFESVGWTNANLNDAACGSASIDHDNNPATAPQNICNYRLGGNNFSLPATIPATAGNGTTAGATLNAALLQQLNPGVTPLQLSEGLIPRLARPVDFSGNRERVAGLVSIEYRPNDRMRFYGDTLYSKGHRQFERIDMNWIVRNSNSMVPRNVVMDANNVVLSGEFLNSQFFLEGRPYDEELDFWNFNPGVQVDFTEKVRLDFQLNQSRGWYYREAPSILVATPLGLLVNYSNEGGDFPTFSTSFDLNDPNAGWQWSGGRLNIQNEKRVTHTRGAHFDLRFGDDDANIKVGGAYDEVDRGISGRDNSGAWEDLVCRGIDPMTGLRRGTCDGIQGGATGSTTPLLVPQSQLSSYLRPSAAGFITVDFDRFMADTDYRRLADAAPEGNGTATGVSTGGVDERTKGAYIEFNGKTQFFDRDVRINVGGRYVQTDQAIRGPVTIGGVRQFQTLLSDYDAFLPSFNAAIELADNLIFRVASSRTLTRANPSQMLPNTTFNDVSAQVASQGNPNLSPYLSTNFDLGGEYYTGDEGYIGLTLFAKQLTGFTVAGSNTIPFNQLGIPFNTLTQDQQRNINNRGGPDAALVTVNQQVNAQATLKIQGYEINLVQPLNMVTQGLGFSANYTKVSQSVTGTGINPQATGIAPFTYNATAYYEKAGFMVRASYTHNDDIVITAANTGGQNGIPSAQLFGDAYSQLDLSSSYQLSNLPGEPAITLNVNNVLGEHRRSTFMFNNATNSLYDPGYSVILGLRMNF